MRYKKYNTFFSIPRVSKPVVMLLFGKYDGQIKKGEKCILNWNRKKTAFDSKNNKTPNYYLPAWLIDQLYSSPDKIIVQIITYLGAKYRFTKLHIRWTEDTGRLTIISKWLVKNPGENTQWIRL